jgi:hypothetical protein
MIQFVCDTCRRVKKDDGWVLGLAAEQIGAVSARREVNILSRWSDPESVHPLAVHFCSERCKDKYMEGLFGKAS